MSRAWNLLWGASRPTTKSNENSIFYLVCVGGGGGGGFIVGTVAVMIGIGVGGRSTEELPTKATNTNTMLVHVFGVMYVASALIVSSQTKANVMLSLESAAVRSPLLLPFLAPRVLVTGSQQHQVSLMWSGFFGIRFDKF